MLLWQAVNLAPESREGKFLMMIFDQSVHMQPGGEDDDGLA